MKVALQWKYPMGVKPEDLYTFELKEQIELPLLTSEGSDEKTIFLKGKSVTGTPALVRMKNLESGEETIVEGVLVKSENGHYLIPKEFVKKDPKLLTTIGETASEIVNETAKTTEKIVSKVEKIDTEKMFGFTPKQLLVMGVAMIIVIKLLK